MGSRSGWKDYTPLQYGREVGTSIRRQPDLVQLTKPHTTYHELTRGFFRAENLALPCKTLHGVCVPDFFPENAQQNPTNLNKT
jgi:hypothetical protein